MLFLLIKLIKTFLQFLYYMLWLQVIVIDWNEQSVELHPENAFKLPRWTGNDDDTTLYDLAAFLKSKINFKIICLENFIEHYHILNINNLCWLTKIWFHSIAILTSNVQDVRDVLNYYRQFDNPLEMFKENRRKFLVSHYKMWQGYIIKYLIVMIIRRCKWRRNKISNKTTAKYLSRDGNHLSYGTASQNKSITLKF